MPPGGISITEEKEVLRLGAGVVGKPGRIRGLSLPLLKQDNTEYVHVDEDVRHVDDNLHADH